MTYLPVSTNLKHVDRSNVRPYYCAYIKFKTFHNRDKIRNIKNFLWLIIWQNNNIKHTFFLIAEDQLCLWNKIILSVKESKSISVVIVFL